MKLRLNFARTLGAILIVALLFIFIGPELAEARRGGGGGFRGSRSFGGSRSATRSKPSTLPRRSTPTTQSKANNLPPTQRSSFGGSRLNSSRDYTAKYGTPRNTQAINGRNAAGLPQNYVVHNYGGFGNSLMMGYMLGQTSWMWSMPFHPAFYYSRPYEVRNADGTIGVYPPRFSMEKLFFTLLIVGAIIYIIYRLVRGRKSISSRSEHQSSFS